MKMEGELILFQPKDMPKDMDMADVKVAIGQRLPDESISVIAKFESWQAVREYSKYHIQLGKSHLDVAEKIWSYCDQYESSDEAKIPPIILDAFTKDEEPDDNKKDDEENGNKA